METKFGLFVSYTGPACFGYMAVACTKSAFVGLAVDCTGLTCFGLAVLRLELGNS